VVCLVFISLKAALSYSPRALGLFLLHHFSYCGCLFAVTEDGERNGQMDRAREGFRDTVEP